MYVHSYGRAGSIRPFLDGVIFSPDVTKTMSVAYAAAVAKLPDKSRPILNQVIARRIINRVKRGEFDADRLRRFALAGIGVVDEID